MRTTVRLPDDLLRRAKRYAADHGTTLTTVLAEGLQQRLAGGGAGRNPRAAKPMPIFRGTGARPGVDLTRTSELIALTEKRRGPS